MINSLLNHTHCQVALKSRHTNHNLSKSMAIPAHEQTEEDKARKHNWFIFEFLDLSINSFIGSFYFQYISLNWWCFLETSRLR